MSDQISGFKFIIVPSNSKALYLSMITCFPYYEKHVNKHHILPIIAIHIHKFHFNHCHMTDFEPSLGNYII